MKRPLRVGLRIAVPVAALLIAWAVLRPSPIAVETARVGRGVVQMVVEEEGESRVHDRYVITAPVTGQLRRPTLREGDRVAAAQTLAVIEPAPLGARALEEARARLSAALDAQRVASAALAQARLAAEQAAREQERAASLFERGLLAIEAKERVDVAAQSARRELDAANSREKMAVHEAEQARAVVQPRGADATIALTSPVDGRVLRVNEPDERVVAFGTPLMEIGDTSHLEVVADLLSIDAVKVAAGDTVEVSGWGRDSTLVGVVDVVEPSGFTKVSALGVEEQRVNVRAMLANPPRELGDRFRVTVRVILWRGRDVLRVPRGAAVQNGDEWTVFVVDGGRCRARAVAVGHHGSGFVEVVGGLEEGEEVVMYPDERIEDGTAVRATPLP